MNHHYAAIAEILFENGPVSLKINGNSMRPSFHNGQPITAIPLPRGPLHHGKCYIYIAQGTLVVHRLLWSFRKTVFMAGDSNNYIERVNREDLVGMPVSESNPATRMVINVINTLFLPFPKFPRIFRIRSKLITLILKGADIEKTV